jgi:hypothetical protein
MTPDRRLAAALLCGVTSAPLTWWLVGDLTSTRYPADHWDYSMRTPAALEDATPLVGVVCLAIAALAILVLMTSESPHPFVNPTLRLAGAGSLLGLAGRIATKGYMGADIGGGPMVMLALGTAVYLTVSGVRRLTGVSRNHHGRQA